MDQAQAVVLSWSGRESRVHRKVAVTNAEARSAGKAQSDLHVLVVEDEPRLREMLARSLRDMGFISFQARTGEEALRQLETETVDIIILDLNLPGINGIEVLRTARKSNHNLPVIILTGYGDLDSARQAIHLDVVEFLTKPCPLGDLEAALERARRRIAASRPAPAPVAVTPPKEWPQAEPGESMEDIERRHIMAALARHGGNRANTAAELGISLRKLYYRLAQYEGRGQQPSSE